MDDLMVALALYRPGPLTGGLKGAFVRRHRGEEQADYLHPKLEPLLRDTYGVILYQEQVLQIAHELAGLSLVDSDLLRRAMSHFDPGKQMVTLKAKFIAGAVRKSGVPEDVAERVWELMAAFAGYGFPKAHAASYAQVAWRSAWCKAHYPALFMAAVLANWGGYYSQRVYLMEARRMGLKIRPPNINHAEREFSLRYIDGEAVLFMGFDQVRDLTKRTQKRILHEQPFHSLPDFIARVDPRPVEAENLTKVGALEGLGTIPWLLRQLEGGGWRGGQLSLFALEGGDEDDWPLDERVAAQETILGVGVDAHPLELVSEEIDSAGALNTVEAASKADQRIRVAGMRQIWRRFTNYRGERVYYMSLEDLEGMIDVVISASVYRRSQEQFSGRGPYIVEGTVELDEDSGEPFMRAERVWGIR
jgi:DNA polymerase-3 subunit alpha